MKTILIVEDEFAVADTLSEFLTDAGYKTVAAVDGKEGLARLAESHPDLVLLDVMMPIVDGLEMLRTMRAQKDSQATPVILMTASPRPDKSTGFTDFVAKPFTIDTLMAKIARIIGAPDTATERREDAGSA